MAIKHPPPPPPPPDPGAAIVKLAAWADPPPGVGLTTVMAAVPAVEISDVVMAAVNCDEEIKVVGRGELFQRTSELLMKLLPLTVNENAALPAWELDGLKLLMTGTGLLMTKFTAVEVPPPGAGLTTVTADVPAVAISTAGIDAVSCVEET